VGGKGDDHGGVLWRLGEERHRAVSRWKGASCRRREEGR
jgi:hypothetical protein